MLPPRYPAYERLLEALSTLLLLLALVVMGGVFAGIVLIISGGYAWGRASDFVLVFCLVAGSTATLGWAFHYLHRARRHGIG